MISYINKNTYFAVGEKTDIRESRARYCRCVYDTSDSDKRLNEFVAAMEVDVSSTYDQNIYDENYPLLQDVIDARLGEMADLKSFLPGWKIEYAGDSDRWHGLTNSVTSTITIHVESDSTPATVAEVLMHEVGHAIDVDFLSVSFDQFWFVVKRIHATWAAVHEQENATLRLGGKMRLLHRPRIRMTGF